ncbi:hypothetical protein M422DRAFT_255300 [Sphaerobolus stellatus SS14]|uniref:Uncharacterized protein n=1 Tax=Sphaerobolus stellatus (strain SS14) TaxID=990650 RepID=A0A0C9VT45_SPHS4|nr:hypothetical protein M422DRAFT_255300 [Sphaerobolus stellatus SS14]
MSIATAPKHPNMIKIKAKYQKGRKCVFFRPLRTLRRRCDRRRLLPYINGPPDTPSHPTTLTSCPFINAISAVPSGSKSNSARYIRVVMGLLRHPPHPFFGPPPHNPRYIHPRDTPHHH